MFYDSLLLIFTDPTAPYYQWILIIMINENKNKISNKINNEEINSGTILKVLY